MNRREFLWGAGGTAVVLREFGMLAESLARDQPGSPSVRDPSSSIFVSTSGDDNNPGTKSRPLNPADCAVEDTLIHQTGQVEKQTATVEIDIAKRITVRHCSLYDVPRAGINVGDGCWGGHHIDCDVFDTVKEAGDHGLFNSWGRDRYWEVKGIDLDAVLGGPQAKLPMLDATEPNTLSNSRWRCDHGWDIDLDDGSTNYHIYNNLCLNGGLKLREGFYRICENNILVNNSLHAHAWFNDSHDIFRNNVVFAPYRTYSMRKWTEEIDYNLLHKPGQPTAPATALQKLGSQDSIPGREMFSFLTRPQGTTTSTRARPHSRWDLSTSARETLVCRVPI